MLSKKTPYGQEMEIQTEYKWTTGCGFIWWLVFLMIFFSFAGLKYNRLSTIKSQSTYQSMEPSESIPIFVNGTDLTPKFRINFDITNIATSDYIKNVAGSHQSIKNRNIAGKICGDI